jgi:hypothetical protein
VPVSLELGMMYGIDLHKFVRAIRDDADKKYGDVPVYTYKTPSVITDVSSDGMLTEKLVYETVTRIPLFPRDNDGDYFDESLYSDFTEAVIAPSYIPDIPQSTWPDMFD